MVNYHTPNQRISTTVVDLTHAQWHRQTIITPDLPSMGTCAPNATKNKQTTDTEAATGG